MSNSKPLKMEAYCLVRKPNKGAQRAKDKIWVQNGVEISLHIPVSDPTLFTINVNAEPSEKAKKAGLVAWTEVLTFTKEGTPQTSYKTKPPSCELNLYSVFRLDKQQALMVTENGTMMQVNLWLVDNSVITVKKDEQGKKKARGGGDVAYSYRLCISYDNNSIQSEQLIVKQKRSEYNVVRSVLEANNLGCLADSKDLLRRKEHQNHHFFNHSNATNGNSRKRKEPESGHKTSKHKKARINGPNEANPAVPPPSAPAPPAASLTYTSLSTVIPIQSSVAAKNTPYTYVSNNNMNWVCSTPIPIPVLSPPPMTILPRNTSESSLDSSMSSESSHSEEHSADNDSECSSPAQNTNSDGSQSSDLSSDMDFLYDNTGVAYYEKQLFNGEAQLSSFWNSSAEESDLLSDELPDHPNFL